MGNGKINAAARSWWPEAKPRVIENAKKRIISNVINRAPIVSNEAFSISLITTHNLLSMYNAPGL
jgi:hypothetical protein